MNIFKKIQIVAANKVKKRKFDSKVKKYKRVLNVKDKNLLVYGDPIVIKEPQNVTVGNNCRFNEHVFIHGGGGVTLGDNVTLSAYTKVISWSYDTNDWESNYIKKDHVGSPIYIGDGAWIGAGAIILPGVKITGKGVIVAAGSVVTGDINEDFVLVGGTPAKKLKSYNKAQ